MSLAFDLKRGVRSEKACKRVIRVERRNSKQISSTEIASRGGWKAANLAPVFLAKYAALALV